MPALVLCFHIHQPYRLRRLSFFDAGMENDCFNTLSNREIMTRVAARCYLPAIAALERIVEKVGADFSCAFSITGTAFEQMREYAPKALESLQRLIGKPSIEVMGETYYHSLASLIEDSTEFVEQVKLHRELLRREFNVEPRVFRNTELIHSDTIADCVRKLGFSGIVVEGIPEIMQGLPSRRVYEAPHAGVRILARDFYVSDEIAFRFTAGSRDGVGFSAESFVRNLANSMSGNEVVCLYVDFETFGEHYSQSSGILSFLEQLPQEILRTPGWRLLNPSQVFHEQPSSGVFSCPFNRSWADSERDVSAWLGNTMQQKALQQIYREDGLREHALDLWRKLQTSDHFYYMSTKSAQDGDVHKLFSPFEGPYEAFIAYMNALRAVSYARPAGNSVPRFPR